MKQAKFIILLISCILFKVGVVNASDDGFYEVTDEAALNECLEKENACKLTQNINLTSKKVITKDLILDLNGHSLTADSSLNLKSGLITLNRGSKLTINDYKGTGKISTGEKDNVWAAINLLNDNDSNELAELIVNGGTIEGYYYGITGNGNYNNTKITINNGNIKGLNNDDSAGIYQPQIGELIINNGNISGGTGIEIRAGNLTVNNGSIQGTAKEFIKMVNGSGTTTNGVGIAIAQHTTKNPITVNINDGNISGEYALYEWNPHNNSEEDIKKISLHIYDGNFTGTATGVKAIYSEDFTKFVSGGKFNTQITEYLTDDAKTTSSVIETNTKLNVNENKKSPIAIIISVIAIAFISLGAVYLYNNKYKFKNINLFY